MRKKLWRSIRFAPLLIVVVTPLALWLPVLARPLPDDPEAMTKFYVREVLHMIKELKESGSADATNFLWAHRRMWRLGNAALPFLKRVYLRLSPADRLLLYDDATTEWPYWPILTPEAGEFLFSQLDSLPEDRKADAMVLIGRCRRLAGAAARR